MSSVRWHFFIASLTLLAPIPPARSDAAPDRIAVAIPSVEDEIDYL